MDDNKLDIVIYQGADFRRVLSITDEEGDAVDLTGYAFRGQARVKYDSASAAFEFDFTLRDQDANTGEVEWALSDTDSESVTLREVAKYYYDVEMVDSDGIVTKILRGMATMYPQVTR
jgi:hypothetical protein